MGGGEGIRLGQLSIALPKLEARASETLGESPALCRPRVSKLWFRSLSGAMIKAYNVPLGQVGIPASAVGTRKTLQCSQMQPFLL